MHQIAICREKSTGLLFEVHINSNGPTLKVSCRRTIDKTEPFEEITTDNMNNLDDRFTVVHLRT